MEVPQPFTLNPDQRPSHLVKGQGLLFSRVASALGSTAGFDHGVPEPDCSSLPHRPVYRDPPSVHNLYLSTVMWACSIQSLIASSS